MRDNWRAEWGGGPFARSEVTAGVGQTENKGREAMSQGTTGRAEGGRYSGALTLADSSCSDSSHTASAANARR